MSIKITAIMCALKINNRLYLGKDNQLLFDLPFDKKYFKETTMGHVCYMGYNTYKSLPDYKLSGRTIVVLTRKHYDEFENKKICADLLPKRDDTCNIIAYQSLDDLISDIESDKELLSFTGPVGSSNPFRLFCCGGTQIYNNLLNYGKYGSITDWDINLIIGQDIYNEIDLFDAVYIHDITKFHSFNVIASPSKREITTSNDEIEYRHIILK